MATKIHDHIWQFLMWIFTCLISLSARQQRRCA